MQEGPRKLSDGTFEPVLPSEERPCVWMLAGVLTCWLCDRDLACESCPLDAALRHADRRTRPKRAEREPFGSTRGALPARTPTVPQGHSGPNLEESLCGDLAALPADGFYHRDHMWVRSQPDGRARVGLDAFASRVVGRLRCVVLPPVGTRLQMSRPCAWLDMPGGTLTLLAPISGRVVRCNADLLRRTDLEIGDPFENDWLLELQPFRIRTETKNLIRATAFTRQVEEDMAAWQREIKRIRESEASLGRTLADGGCSVRTLVELLGARGVHRLAVRFLSRPSGGKAKDGKSR